MLNTIKLTLKLSKTKTFQKKYANITYQKRLRFTKSIWEVGVDFWRSLWNPIEGDELEILSILIEKYEKEHYPIAMSEPIEAIKFRMEQLGMKQKDLAEILGFKSRVSEILNKKRKLTLKMIRKLHQKLSIPTDTLIQNY